MKRSDTFHRLFSLCFDDLLSKERSEYIDILRKNIGNARKFHISTTKRMPDGFEKAYIIPKEWLRENNLTYGTYGNRENEIYMPSTDFFRSLILLSSYFRNRKKYSKGKLSNPSPEEMQKNISIARKITQRIERLLKTWCKRKYGPQETHTLNTYRELYSKITNLTPLSHADYENIQKLLEHHYEKRRVSPKP